MKTLSRILCGLAVCCLLAAPAAALAQAVDEGVAADEAAATANNEATTATAAAGSQAALESAVEVRIAVGETLAVIPHLPGAIAEAVAARGGTHPGWFSAAIFLTFASMLIAGAVWYFVRRRIGRVLTRLSDQRASVPAYRTSYVLTRSLLVVFADILFVFVGVILIILFVPDPGPARMTAIIVLLATGFFLIFRDLFVSLYLPHRPQERVLALSDDDAKSMLVSIVAVSAVGAVSLGVSNWAGGFGVDERTHDAMRIVASGIGILLFAAYFIVHRRKITPLVRGSAPRPSGLGRLLTALWLPLVLTYLVVGYVLSIANVVSAEGARAGPILAPILAAVAGFTLYGLCVVALARRFAADEAVLRAISAADETPEAERTVQPVTLWRMRWHRLFRKLAAIASCIAAFGVLLALWQTGRPLSERTELFGLLVILFVAYALYAAARTWIDGKIEEETAMAGPSGDSEDGMGPGSSRLSTLLPLMRNSLTVVGLTIGAMVGLSALGVDVAPLFAGAGVVGLAVGFGAQTLIRDVFSGAFFLLDDAFRRGEYIDVGGAMGSVEKISVRSFQLRHHNGPLHTIPFGEIKQLTNFSRDWVIMKLPLRIPYGTDVEKVRKLVKKLGQQLAADPEIGPLFLQPLKSQGVVEMDDSAMIMRVKFMTKPGDQFLTRRHVFTRIGELFEKEGIKFAHRQVTVRIAGQGDEDVPDEVAAQAGAAASQAIAQPAKA